MFTGILWRFLILATFVMRALCKCPHVHPQKQFCTSEFVLKVKVSKEIHFLAFRVDILKVFKGNIKELRIWDNRYTNMGINMKYNFKFGRKYIIFGRNLNGYIYSDICHGNEPSVISTKFYRRSLARYYRKGCDCIYNMPRYTVANDCHWSYSFLIRRGKNCRWAQTTLFKSCQMEATTSTNSE